MKTRQKQTPIHTHSSPQHPCMVSLSLFAGPE